MVSVCSYDNTSAQNLYLSSHAIDQEAEYCRIYNYICHCFCFIVFRMDPHTLKYNQLNLITMLEQQ